MVISGADGGYSDDNGGTLSNGLYKVDGEHNGKPKYVHVDDSGCYIRFETPSEWGGLNMAGSKHAWTSVCKSHHRYWIDSEADTPPLDVPWNIRPDSATRTTGDAKPMLAADCEGNTGTGCGELDIGQY